MRHKLLPPIVALVTLAISAGVQAADTPKKFVVLSEFQVWADASGPEVYREFNKLYLTRGRCHSFMLYPRYDYFVWDVDRMKHWVDEAVALKAFNVFCLGDDTRTAQGRLFTPEGLNPNLAETYFQIIEYAHQKGLMVSIEPVGLPKPRDKEHFVAWLKTWIGPDVPKARRADIIKLSIEWFGAFGNPPNIAYELEAFFEAAREVNPDVLVYVDSIGGQWRRPQPLHRWLLTQYPGTIISHYLNVDQVDAFREMGARNMMVQINPCEAVLGGPSHLFLYFHETVAFLQKAMKKRVRYVSLAGVNYAYSRRDFDLFLDVIRPHLKLAPDVESLRKSLVPDQVAEPVTKEGVKSQLEAVRAEQRKKRKKR
ncbi:MAG: hypothetical protein JW818_18015 [Pirellulales bacterium]|nr:hypothetical protein [Pirellulales bacterium]